MSGCTRKAHDAIMKDPARVITETTHVGWQGFDGEWLELRNCAYCRSTLARKAAVVAEDEKREGDRDMRTQKREVT